jgi:predicted MPP superfamily phosphohydrolase
MRFPLLLLIPLAVMLSLLGGLHHYLWLRLVSAPGLPAWGVTAGTALLIAGTLAFPAGMVGQRLLPRRYGAPLAFAAFGWMGCFSFLLVGTALLDAARWVGLELTASGQAALALGFALPAVAWGYRTARGPATVEDVTVAIPSLGEGFSGFKIVQLSDIHVGPTVDGAHLSRMVDQALALGPDLVVVTGDLVDGSVQQLRDEVAPLARLCAAPLGAYFVTGNHEYYSGGRAWEAEVARLGLRVLHNAHVVLERGGARLVLAGVTDLEGGRFSEEDACRPDRALEGSPAGVPRVLLAHQPRVARLLERLSVKVDLQLSGHTHGGQFFPWMFFVKLQQPVVQGLSTVAGTQVYTHRGTGYWGPPLRLGPTPEISLLRLVPAPPSR